MKSKPAEFDIAVVGAGPVGVTTALLAAERGWRTALIGPDISAADGRTVALLKGSVQLMRHLGVWDAMEAKGAPLKAMRLIDDTGRLLRAPTVTFDAEELGEPWFGVNVPVSEVTAILNDAVADAEAIFRFPETVETTDTDDHGVDIRLSGGRTIRAAVAVAADGRKSVCREAAGIRTRSHRYPQSAVVINMDHDRDHGSVSTEFHRPSGPFTLVPLPGRRSALVCVVTSEEAEALCAMDEQTLSTELTRQSHSLLGKLVPVSRARSFPLGSQTADRFAAGRTFLVGEAAHIMPPIGAQGLNLGLRDVAALIEALAALPDFSDVSRAVASYHAARAVDVGTRMTAIHLLNRSLLSGFFGYQGARSLGMFALQSFGPLRRLAMREGMLPSYATPALMRDDQVSRGALR